MSSVCVFFAFWSSLGVSTFPILGHVYEKAPQSLTLVQIARALVLQRPVVVEEQGLHLGIRESGQILGSSEKVDRLPVSRAVLQSTACSSGKGPRLVARRGAKRATLRDAHIMERNSSRSMQPAGNARRIRRTKHSVICARMWYAPIHFASQFHYDRPSPSVSYCSKNLHCCRIIMFSKAYVELVRYQIGAFHCCCCMSATEPSDQKRF
jgi:hypothetical protein